MYGLGKECVAACVYVRVSVRVPGAGPFSSAGEATASLFWLLREGEGETGRDSDKWRQIARARPSRKVNTRTIAWATIWGRECTRVSVI